MHAENVTFPVNGDSARGYLAQPDGDGPFPAVVVIQEWWGLDAHIQVTRGAVRGRRLCCPRARSLSRAGGGGTGRRPQARDEHEHGRGALRDSRRDVVPHRYTAVEPKSIGVIGFCMGGRLTLATASTGDDRIGAVAAFYGGGVQPTPEFVKGIAVPVLAVYGEEDQGIPAEQREALAAEMDRQEKTFDMVVYPGAQHAFMNDMRPAYNANAASDAWTRAVQWFHTHIS